MALFSAWDWDRNAYRVYMTRQMVSIGDDPKPPKPSLRHPLGAVPDVDAKPLPIGAKFMGYSHQARGEIVKLPAGTLGRLGDIAESVTPDVGKLLLVLLVGVGIGVFVARRKG